IVISLRFYDPIDFLFSKLFLRSILSRFHNGDPAMLVESWAITLFLAAKGLPEYRRRHLSHAQRGATSDIGCYQLKSDMCAALCQSRIAHPSRILRNRRGYVYPRIPLRPRCYRSGPAVDLFASLLYFLP